MSRYFTGQVENALREAEAETTQLLEELARKHAPAVRTYIEGLRTIVTSMKVEKRLSNVDFQHFMVDVEAVFGDDFEVDWGEPFSDHIINAWVKGERLPGLENRAAMLNLMLDRLLLDLEKNPCSFIEPVLRSCAIAAEVDTPEQGDD